MSVSEELARLVALRDQGVLSEEEFQTQKAAVMAGSGPAQAAPSKAKKSPVKVGCLTVIGIIAVLLIIGLFAGPQKSTGGSTSENSPKAEAVAVTAEELFQAYQANEAAAQQQYGDKTLTVSGTVASIDLDITDDPVVMLRTSNEFMPVHAPLADESKPRAASLSKGQTVELTCSGVSEVISTPMLKDCVLR